MKLIHMHFQLEQGKGRWNRNEMTIAPKADINSRIRSAG